MSDTHAGRWVERPAGQCQWRHHHEDVDMWCADEALPGGVLCADHSTAQTQAASPQVGLVA